PGHAVIFRQAFGGLPAAQDGMITLGVTKGRIAYVSSSAAGDEPLTGSVRLTPAQAWLKAAESVGVTVPASGITGVTTAGGWTVLRAPAFVQLQRARLRSMPTVTEGARPVYETIVENVAGGLALAYTVFVDAES